MTLSITLALPGVSSAVSVIEVTRIAPVADTDLTRATVATYRVELHDRVDSDETLRRVMGTTVTHVYGQGAGVLAARALAALVPYMLEQRLEALNPAPKWSEMQPSPSSPITRTINVVEDVGTHEPRYDTATLQLHDDGTVTWRKP